MPRPRKESKALNIKLSIEVSEKLERFCKETYTSKTDATEMILDKYLEEYFSKPEDVRKPFN